MFAAIVAILGPTMSLSDSLRSVNGSWMAVASGTRGST
jgi:hypothetical protein